MKTKVSFIDNFITILTAFLLTDNVLIAFIEAKVSEGAGATLSSVLLYIAVITGLFRLAQNNKRWLPAIAVVGMLYLLMRYQYRIAPASVIDNYAPKFFMNGVGGFIIGFAVKDYYGLIRYASFFSLVYGILFMFEPITLSLLQLTPMQTGYMLTPLAIWLYLTYYVSPKRSKLYLYVAIALSLSIVLFTSRGCALSILLAIFILVYFDNKKTGKNFEKLFSKVTRIGIFIGIVFFASIYYFSQHNTDGNVGSVVNKYINGEVGDSNGREEIWDIGMELVSEHALKGMGMGMDRHYIGSSDNSFVHNVLLELGMNFGIPLMIVILLLYWIPIIKTLRSNISYDYKTLVACMCCMVWVRLLFSDTYLKNMVIIMIVFGVALAGLVKVKQLDKTKITAIKNEDTFFLHRQHNTTLGGRSDKEGTCPA